jgi:hypothetical protein
MHCLISCKSIETRRFPTNRLLSLTQGIGRFAVEAVKVFGFDGIDIFIHRFG